MPNKTVLSYDEFLEFYRKNRRFPHGSYVSPKPLNDTQLHTKYKGYLSWVEKKQIKVEKAITRRNELNIERANTIDEKWEHLKEIVDRRDSHTCRLYYQLDNEERRQIKESFYGKFRTIDRAHVFRRSRYPHMKYDSENVYCLSRLFHSRLDSYQDPITGKAIDEEASVAWWKRIIGEEKYSILEKRAHKQTDN
jgi:hypothetical protein